MVSQDPMAGIPASVFDARRAAVLAALDGGAMVLPSSPILRSSRDTELRYRPDSELFYLTGVTTPGALAVLSGGDEPRFTLFVPERDEEHEVWSGPLPGPDGAAALYGADETYPAAEVEARLPELLSEARALHFRLGTDGPVQRIVVDALRRARTRGQRKGTGPRSLVDPGEVLDGLRLTKDEHEIERIRAAVRVTVQGHRAAASTARPGVGEWEVEASVDAAFRVAGARGPAFPTIVGSGSNGCVLHYVDNRRTIGAGDLVLVDAGADVGLYGGDVTRTLPASGSFTGAQRAVYEIVEAARRSAVDAVCPGAAAADVHAAAVAVLVEGLLDLEVLAGSQDEVIEAEAYKPWFPHQTSHWLGLDVHDPGDYAKAGAPRALRPGMTLTVEPGLYFRPGRGEGAAERFDGIGVRIEDDVLVCEGGREVLSSTLPTSPDDVEQLVAGAREERGA